MADPIFIEMIGISFYAVILTLTLGNNNVSGLGKWERIAVTLTLNKIKMKKEYIHT